MLESEAVAIVAALQAAFPRGADREETLQLHRANLLRHEPGHAARAIRELIDTRTDPWFPTWAEVANAIRANQPPHRRELEQPTSGPDPETARRIARFIADTKVSDRSNQWLRDHDPAKNRPIGYPRSRAGLLWIADRRGSVLWDLQPTHDARDDTELRAAARRYRQPLATLRRHLATAQQHPMTRRASAPNGTIQP